MRIRMRKIGVRFPESMIGALKRAGGRKGAASMIRLACKQFLKRFAEREWVCGCGVLQPGLRLRCSECGVKRG
jgi:hypothetical protein